MRLNRLIWSVVSLAPLAANPVFAQQPPSAQPAVAAKVSGVQVNDTTYVIGPRDVLNVIVWEQAPVSCQECLVRPDGMISLPLINEVKAAGLTPDELRKNVATRFAEIYRDPQVSVQVLQINSKKYFVQGEVNKPGEMDLASPTTVMEGLAAAQGFREFAVQKEIIIIRGDERLKFNYKEVLKGKNLQQNVLLRPGDIIVVK
jgi:polysaccharide export outer membrane protein